MTEEQAMLQAVLENPTDDAPRLIMADWLEENSQQSVKPCSACDGDGLATGPPECRPCQRCSGKGRLTVSCGRAERAEFIRVQVELARHPGMNCGFLYCSRRDPGGLCDSCSRFVVLRRRERKLLQAPCVPGGKDNYHWWFSPFDELVQPTNGGFMSHERILQWNYRRGFVESISLTCAAFMDHAKALFQSQPIASVTLSDCYPSPSANDPPVWGWMSRHWPQSSDAAMRDMCEIPPELHDLLPDTAPFDHWKWSRRFFEKPEIALDALSVAAIIHGREAAGLLVKGDHAKAL